MKAIQRFAALDEDELRTRVRAHRLASGRDFGFDHLDTHSRETLSNILSVYEPEEGGDPVAEAFDEAVHSEGSPPTR